MVRRVGSCAAPAWLIFDVGQYPLLSDCRQVKVKSGEGHAAGTLRVSAPRCRKSDVVRTHEADQEVRTLCPGSVGLCAEVAQRRDCPHGIKALRSVLRRKASSQSQPYGPTRRQSQRPSLSRLVLRCVSRKEEHGLFDLLLHEPRQRRSWLIFDVRQKMTIRRALPDEIPAIAAIARESFLAEVAPHYSEQGVQTFLAFAAPQAIAQRAAEDSAAYVALRGAEILGMAMLKNAGHISMLFVASSQQRKGIGRRLVEFLLSEARAAVVTVNSSPNAEAAYVRFGFVRTAHEQVVDGLRFVPMALESKPLNKAPEPTTMAVTSRAPSSTRRASHGRGSS
jgi:predicted N-acetyltransferase YhbS